MTGNFAPDWLYADKEAGGGGLTPILIKTDGQGTQKFPPYLDQRYQAYFLRAIDRFAEHISTLPDAVRSKIIASQAMYGSTGDDCPWHGTPVDPKQDICDGKPSCPRVGEWEDAWHNCNCSRSLCVVFRKPQRSGGAVTMSTAPLVCDSYTRRNISVLCKSEPPTAGTLGLNAACTPAAAAVDSSA